MLSVKQECRNATCPNGDVPSSNLKLCSRCKQAAYCSVECQRSHWKEHKEECKACVEEGAVLFQKKNIRKAGWTYNPYYLPPHVEYRLMQRWEASVPREHLTGRITAKEHMKKLGICPAMVRGLEIGDWGGLVARMVKMNQPVNIRNDPKLMVGDYVEIQPGNDVKASLIGHRGHLETFIEERGKWGIDLESGESTMIMAGNLKRVTKKTPRESPW